MKKVLFLALGICFITGCSKSSVKIETQNKEYETEDYKISMEIPEIKTDIPYQSQFNSDYLSLAGDIFNTFSDEAIKSEAKKDTLTLKQEVKLNKKDILSITGHIEAFTGGSQNQLYRITKNIDLQKCRELSFPDLFTDKGYINRINSYIKTKMKEEPDRFLGLWKVPVATKNQEFYLSPKGVVIYYPPYELSYYSKGFIEIEIPYEELEGYLIPQIQALK